jgi:VIT1/CCC1 family predicted Fe2+/Mn2+ transporter
MPSKHPSPLYLNRDGMVIALSVIGLTGLTVIVLSSTSAVAMAAVLTAMAGVLATVPPIIKAVNGRIR